MATLKNTRQPTGHIAPFGLRLQPELKARAEESAARHGRSLNAEIVHILQNYYAQQDIADTIVGRELAGQEDMFPEIAPDVKDLVEEVKRSIDENIRMRALMNRQLDLLSEMYEKKFDEVPVLEEEVGQPVTVKRIRRSIKK